MKAQERCPGCGRDPRTCWIMPCLVLEVALTKGKRGIQAWLRKSNVCGAKVVRAA